MTIELDRSLDLEFARLLLAESASLEAARIPIRVHPSGTNDNSNRQRHWRRANLKGIHGKHLVIRPLNGHKKDELVDPSFVRLWQSRMPDELVEMVNKLRKKQDDAAAAKVIKPHAQLQAAVQHVFENTETKPPQAELFDTKPEVEEPMKTEETSIPTSFAEQLALFKKLKSQISQRAKGEGIDRLKKLHADRSEAMKMLQTIEDDITTVVSELNDFGVPIPIELSLTKEKAKSKDDSDDKTASHTPKVSKAGWSLKKARSYKPAIVAWLNKQPDAWYTSRQIMAPTGDSETSPSSILSPLVADGTLERQGERADSRYRLVR